MIYYIYLTAKGLAHSGSSTAHIYTHKQYTEYRGRRVLNNGIEQRGNTDGRDEYRTEAVTVTG
jgi:hypothetical protein